MLARVFLVALLLLVGACSDGGSPPSAAPSGLSYPSAPTLAVGLPMAAMSPTVTGTVTSYSVTPALPAGLSLNPSTGAIAGTPTAVTPATTYTVTATNAGGSTSSTLSIAVNDRIPIFTYGAVDFSFTTGIPVSELPLSSGGSVVGWSINPALPAGLTFSTTDGRISGTPTTASVATSYTVTAQNSGGSATANLNITVDSGVLIDLGHAGAINQIRYSGSRILSHDLNGHWVLWNSQTAANLAQGDSLCSGGTCEGLTDLAGPTMAVRTADGLQLRASGDGATTANIVTQLAWWKLATDGSYIAAGSTSGVTVWSPNGTVVFTRAGDYSQAKAFAAPTELRIAAGPAGANVIEHIAIANGQSTTGPQFSGTFHSWFIDGERFLTNLANAVWVYSRAGVQQDAKPLPHINRLTGQGSYFWIQSFAPNVLDIYAVGSNAPATSFALNTGAAAFASGATIGVLNITGNQASVIDLSGSSPAKTDYAAPFSLASAYGARADGAWVIGSGQGLLADIVSVPGTPKHFSYGTVSSLSSGTARVAVATALGKILYFDAATKALQGDIDAQASQVVLSADGTVLAVALTDGTHKIFSLPSETEIRSWPYTNPANPLPRDLSLSASGGTFGRILRGNSGPTYREVIAVGTGAVIYSDSITPPYVDRVQRRLEQIIRFSPNGAAVALPDQGPTRFTVSYVVINGSFATAVTGWPLTWLDNDRFLVTRYVAGTRDDVYEKTVLVNSSGQDLVSLPTLPEMMRAQALTGERIYSPELNRIYSLTTGQAVWTSPNLIVPGIGGSATADQIVFASGATVRAEPY